MHISSKSPWLLKTNSPTIVAVAELFRIDKPAGTYLLLTPCIWSLTMSSIMLLSSYHGLTPPLIENVTQFALQTTLFIVGAYTMRSAGCVINDMHDRELDFKVWRSLQRPIACGRISYSEAWAALIVLSVIGVAILYYGLPWQCWWLGLASLPLIFVYPLFKRFTYYPQIVLSSCFNWGSLLGFAAIFDLPWRPMAGLYLTTFLWCMIYDTIYAHQDKKFDIKANIKSTALKWGSKSKPILYILALVQCLALFDSCYDAGLIGQTKMFSTAGMLTFDYLLFRMIYKVNLDNPANCWHYFRRNVKYGQAFTVGLLLEYFYQLFKASTKEEEDDNSNRRLE
ncbi:4-hydroxybenzoate polyprenyl transferase [Hanseniaspora valbyensis NRRL Y-1626]|uniref:4-hydroxybenzoate polyprenyltransferase, mitochondrial n=1 Tax=Hanseniaspora valbyensis NRRL Y-1626 TaxID=766949 RepID=A0A1B7TCP0_9ASCO|nr:4-hydroxybenzoate polyprenyl transferase [Hanseniaspora valbyensis NRRL Y-1626]